MAEPAEGWRRGRILLVNRLEFYFSRTRYFISRTRYFTSRTRYFNSRRFNFYFPPVTKTAPFKNARKPTP